MTHRLDDSSLPPTPTSELRELVRRARLASLWAFVLLAMLFRDMHEIPTKEFLEVAMVREVPEWLFLVSGMVLTLPLSMVPLNLTLRRRAVAPLNLLAAALMALGMASYPPGDLDDLWFATVEVLALVAITRLTWASRASAAPPLVEAVPHWG